MLARRSLRATRALNATRFFSAKPTEEEGKAEWGIKYDDECLKFEKEWETIAKRVETEQAVYIDKELGDI